MNHGRVFLGLFGVYFCGPPCAEHVAWWSCDVGFPAAAGKILQWCFSTQNNFIYVYVFGCSINFNRFNRSTKHLLCFPTVLAAAKLIWWLWPPLFMDVQNECIPACNVAACDDGCFGDTKRLMEKKNSTVSHVQDIPLSLPGPKAQSFPRATSPTCQAQMTWIPCYKALQSWSLMEPGPCIFSPASRDQSKAVWSLMGSHHFSCVTHWPNKENSYALHVALFGKS